MSTETRSSTNYPPIYYVGFVGDHGSGKTTFADNLQAELESLNLVHVLRINMADALREHLGPALPITPDTKVKHHPLERYTLQYAGEAWRLADKNYWITHFLNKVQQGLWAMEEDILEGPSKPVVVIVADTYNLNELPLMNTVVMLHKRDPASEKPELHILDTLAELQTKTAQKYLAETVRSTQYALNQHAIIADVVDGPVVNIRGLMPSDIGSFDNILFAASVVLQDLTDRVEVLGLPPLALPLAMQQLDPNENRWHNEPVTRAYNVLSRLPVRTSLGLVGA